MNTTHVMALFALSLFAQGALANTIWLKDRQGNVCYNSASTNPGQVIGYGGVNHDGTGFTLTISNPANGTKTPATGDCASIPTAPVANPIVFNGSLTPRLTNVHMWKPGTRNTLECLDQGGNLIGLSGNVIGGTYRLLLSTQFTDGCDMQTQTKITADGLPIIIRTATLFAGGERPIYSGAYHIFNAATVPEPSSMLLLLAGATGMGALALVRRRSSAKAKSVM